MRGAVVMDCGVSLSPEPEREALVPASGAWCQCPETRNTLIQEQELSSPFNLSLFVFPFTIHLRASWCGCSIIARTNHHLLNGFEDRARSTRFDHNNGEMTEKEHCGHNWLTRGCTGWLQRLEMEEHEIPCDPLLNWCRVTFIRVSTLHDFEVALECNKTKGKKLHILAEKEHPINFGANSFPEHSILEKKMQAKHLSQSNKKQYNTV